MKYHSKGIEIIKKSVLFFFFKYKFVTRQKKNKILNNKIIYETRKNNENLDLISHIQYFIKKINCFIQFIMIYMYKITYDDFCGYICTYIYIKKLTVQCIAPTLLMANGIPCYYLKLARQQFSR